MKIQDLRTEYFVAPLGLGTREPRFFWKLDSDQRGARQTAYRITAASRRDLLETPDLWDSGRIESSATTHIAYAGQTLGSRQGVHWRVEAWDENGVAAKPGSLADASAYFEIGLLEPSDWQAQWIGGFLSGAPQTASPAPFLRREFQLSGPIATARLYATALGLYETEINGQRVGSNELAPGWQDYRKRVQYATYDVTPLLQSGANAWGAVLGDGWYCGCVEWRGRQRYGEKPAFLGQLEITYADGRREVVTSDGSWSVGYGPILENDLLQGESYDARQELNGWSSVGFDDAKWAAATVVPATSAELCAPLGPPVKAVQELKPIRAPHNHHGAWIFDLGINMVGRVRLKVSGERGTSIKLRFAETLEGGPKAETGPIYITNLRGAKQTDYYTLKGEGEEVWEPRFTFHGFRYVEVTGFPGEPTVDAITGVVLCSDIPKIGDFECSDPLVNQLQQNIDWGQRGNFVDIPTDCPQRDERLGWTGDAQVFVRTAAFNRDVSGFFSEWARDFIDAQAEDGSIPCIVPETSSLGSTATKGFLPHDGGPAWADAVVICPWTIYRTTGDLRILQDNYKTFAGYVEYLHSTSKDGLRGYEGATYFKGFGDWLALDGSGKTDGGTPKELICTAFYAHSSNLLSGIANILGHEEDAARFAGYYESASAAFTRRFVTEDGLLSPPYQTPYVLALEFNLVPEALRAKVAEGLIAAIHERGDKLSTGFVGAVYLNHVLTASGNLDMAYKLLFQKQWPSWLFAVTQGATTIWERWDGWTPEKGFQDAGMNSFNHYAYGAIGAWLYQVVAGIELDPKVPGYGHFLLQPQPGPGLTSASAHVETLHGRIESSWTLKDGVFEWSFTVPANTSARVRVPGEKVGVDADLRKTGEEPGAVIYEAGAGRYRVTSKVE